MAERKSVLITGASKGSIGDALAKEFHRKGFRVFATGRDPNKISHLTDLGIETIILDVTNPEDVQKAAAHVAALTNNRLDILINNAGAFVASAFTDVSVPEMRQIFELNVFSIVTVTQAFVPLLINANGLVANQSSVAGQLGPPLQTIYNSSKAAVTGMTSTMRMDLAPLGVRVTELMTSGVDTGIITRLGHARIPEDSYYAPAKEKLEHMMNGGQLEGAVISVEAYAKSTVADLTKRKVRPQVWRGAYAWLLWFVWCIVPVGWLDSSMNKLMGLNELRGKVKTA